MNEQQQVASHRRKGQELFTTITTALFLVIASTGVMLLLGVGRSAVQGAHEWLGLAFTVVAVGHAVYHWRSVMNYARRPTLWVAAAVALVATFAFVAPSQAVHGPNPMRATIELVRQAPLDRVAALASVDAGELEARLRAAGVQFSGMDQSLAEVERSSGRHMPELLAIITQNQAESAVGGM